MSKYLNKYRIESTRKQSWDYGWNGRYFITIVTKNRKHFFGKIEEGKMFLSDIGEIANLYLKEIANHFPFTTCKNSVVMPDHIHSIIEIANPTLKSNKNKLLGKNRYQNQGQNTISSIVGSYKSIVTRTAHKINPNYGWHTNYYDHIIKDNDEYERIKWYIINNPKKWTADGK